MQNKLNLIDKIDSEKIGVKGNLYLVKADTKAGFNFPYTLFIPDEMDESISLIVEGANTGQSREDINIAIDDVIKDCMKRKIIRWNNETNFPILTPCFPRIYTKEDGGIYTHMLTSQSLKFNKLNLERIDNQLVCMIKHSFDILNSLGFEVDDKVILDGFSASAKFVNRFALLHPEIVKLVIAGACSGTGILPLKYIENEKILYPIGCGDLDEITPDKIEEFKKIKQFYYMTSLDPINNDPLGEKTDGSLISPSSITREEANQLYKYIGKKMFPDRWKNFQKIYTNLRVNATFETYYGYSHDPAPAEDDVRKLLEEERINNLDIKNNII